MTPGRKEAKHPEPLGVNAGTESAEIRRRQSYGGRHGKSWAREGRACPSGLASGFSVNRVKAEPVDAQGKHEER